MDAGLAIYLETEKSIVRVPEALAFVLIFVIGRQISHRLQQLEQDRKMFVEMRSAK